MAITVSTISPHTRLTTPERVQSELGIADARVLDDLVDRASAAVESYCHQTFARETLTETLPGYGGIHLQLARTPIVSVSAVSDDGTVLTDYSVADAKRGWLYRQAGWGWTVQAWPGLSGSLSFLDVGQPVPRSEEPLFSVTYIAGYILPPANVTAETISASAVDNSFNDSASGFPSNLKSGDIITVSGFATAANNGRFVVSGTPTTAKVIVTATLGTEAASATSKTFIFQSLPYDVEKATIETAKAYYARRASDGSVIEKQAGPMRVRYSETGIDPQGIPATAVGLLRPWVRAA